MKANPEAGVCGSTLPFYGNPDILWARGGARYNKWIPFLSKCIDHSTSAARSCNPMKIEQEMDFVAGASMIVSRPFLREIGLLCEEYFLYFEELDWAMRARGRFLLAYSPGSIVYHKVGASTGMMGTFPARESKTLRYYIRRNSILFTRKYHPYTLPTVYFCFALYGIYSFFRDRIRGLIGRKGNP
jgi:GT2 family glycosyltransferase